MATSPPIKLTSLAALKQAIDEPANDTSIDVYLTAVIASVSAAIINYLGREVATASYTEQFDIEVGQRRWFLKAYPVDSVTTVKVDHNWEFPSATQIDAGDFLLYSGRGLAYIELRYDEAPGPGAMQVVYTGGMGATTAQLTSGFPEVEAAAQLWCSAIVKKRKGGPGSETISLSSGTVTKSELVMPKIVKELLEPLRRISGISQ